MNRFQLITDQELDAFAALLAGRGLDVRDFELQESAFDQQSAEVEAALGEVGVRRLPDGGVGAYRVGPGRDWVADFGADLAAGKL